MVGARNVAHELHKTLPASSTPTEGVTEAPEGLATLTWGNMPELKAIEGTLRQIMWNCVGVIRHDDGLRQGLTQLYALQAQCQSNQWMWLSPEGVDVWQQLTLAILITQSALLRRESRGAHYRSDYPDTAATPYHSQCVLGYDPTLVPMATQSLFLTAAAVA